MCLPANSILIRINFRMNKIADKSLVFALGRRKAASAEVRLYTEKSAKWGEMVVEKGEIFVNNKKAADYFGKENEIVYMEPLRVTNTQGKFAITAKVAGGGKKGQLDAVVLGIARALNTLDREKYRSILKNKGLLTRDPRVRERRKVGMGGKARRRKQSPKR